LRLIVTEKDSAARKIAEILGQKVVTKEHGRGRQKVKSYHFDDAHGESVSVGLRGHVMESVFPNSYRRWSLKHLGEMIDDPDLAWIVDGTAATTLLALRSAAKGASEVVIATDYDREGELIGHEALEILRGDALKRHPHDKLGPDSGRGRGGVRQTLNRRLQPGRCRPLASGHRPYLGCRAHALHVVGLVSLRLGLSLGGARANADFAPHR
jgi:hypothetical protein